MQFMNNIELAKQLKGVYVGKYSEKAFQLKAHSDENFEKDKEEFIKILEKTLPLIQSVKSTESCVITLDNTLDIIKAEGFIETLVNTKSKIEFLQNIGVTGNGVLLNITDASTINPWVTQIKHVSTSCPVLSTVAIEDLIGVVPDSIQLTQQEETNCVVVIQTGSGQIEKLNCIIPLFEKEVAKALAPIIRTNLFQLICTYSIQKSPFTLNHNAHLGGLAGLLGYLLTQPPTEWRKSTINKIKYTTQIYTNSRKLLKQFIEKLWVDPIRTVVSEIPNEEIKCESITKLLLMILVSAKDKTPQQIELVMTHVWKEYIGRIIGTKILLTDLFELTNPEVIGDEIEFPPLDSIYAHGYTVIETKKAIEKTLRSIKFSHPDTLEFKFNIEKLHNEFNGGSVGNLVWKGLITFTNTLGIDISEENILQFAVHGLIHSGSADRMNQIKSYSDSKSYILNELIGIKFREIKEQKIHQYLRETSERYFEIFAQEHQNIFPMNKQDIINKAEELGIHVNQDTFDDVYKFNPDNGLLSNACASKSCPFYLIPRTDFSAHIERLKNNPDFIHSYHRTIFAQRNKTICKIIDSIKSGEFRPLQYKNTSIEIPRIILEKYSGDIEINKDIYMSIYD